MTDTSVILNYLDNQWIKSSSSHFYDVQNPATGEIIGKTPLSDRSEVDKAVASSQKASKEWRKTPPSDRIQYLYKLKGLLEENVEELSQTITIECGKTLEESRGEIKRAIENVEVACGIPKMMQGSLSEDIAHGIDELMIRQPLGVCAVIAPFNFPGMIPFWFMPYALACGNAMIIKPSERVPLTMQKVFQLIDKIDLPAGVINLVNGSQEAVNALLDHPDVRGVSFVGSTKVARYIYQRAAEKGKRAQCQGGAKNPVVVLPDADVELSTKIIADSAFGCAGQRCLAASVMIGVGDAYDTFRSSLIDAAKNRKVGFGLEEGVQMGPVISPESKIRIENIISDAEKQGAAIPVDGRNTTIPNFEKGNFIRPTILENLPESSDILSTEIFGPVLTLRKANSLEEAIQIVNGGRYGNMACIFTNDGSSARQFRYECEAGNIGINIGVAAPIAYFPFSGWKDSFFGDLHGQSMDAVDFFTQKKVVVERWPKVWSRKF